MDLCAEEVVMGVSKTFQAPRKTWIMKHMTIKFLWTCWTCPGEYAQPSFDAPMGLQWVAVKHCPFFKNCLIFYKPWTPDSQSLTPGLKKSSLTVFLPTPAGPDSQNFYVQNSVFWCLPKGISNRRYSNTLFLPTPASADPPILHAQLGVFRHCQKSFQIEEDRKSVV